MRTTLRALRWLSLAACVSVPHVMPAAFQLAASLLLVFTAAALDFASTRP
jgi:hypothetical protein